MAAMMAMTAMQGKAQGIIVFEHNGTQVNIPAAEFESITPDQSANLKGVVVKRTDGTTFKVSESQLDSVITFAKAYDERLTYAIPEEYINKMGQHMPIFNGNNPPNIEGTYELSPNIAVFFEDKPNNTGHEYTGLVNKFQNQDMQKNTLDYAEHDKSHTTETSSKGAAVIGDGANFTCFFISEGSSNGISVKLATLISGTKTNNGIKNMYYGFILLDKGDDPDSTLMKKGVFRVFKDGDGTSNTTTWANGSYLEMEEEPLQLPYQLQVAAP